MSLRPPYNSTIFLAEGTTNSSECIMIKGMEGTARACFARFMQNHEPIAVPSTPQYLSNLFWNITYLSYLFYSFTIHKLGRISTHTHKLMKRKKALVAKKAASKI